MYETGSLGSITAPATHRPKARKPSTPAEIYAKAEERELLGMTTDGRLVLWDTGRVVPITRFR
ncbi:MAG TPA: hypothetical protein VFL55_01230, partial [Acetobacteraceae bacterium]|nr:hypothetical protein [Acetobacteraceae bacterium]